MSVMLLENHCLDQQKTNMPCKHNNRKKCRSFLRKYFWEGQKFADDKVLDSRADSPHTAGVSWDVQFYRDNRKLLGFLIPFAFFHITWWILAVRYNLFARYRTHYEMPITMILGATVAGTTVVLSCEIEIMALDIRKSPAIAGMTSEGGGAVAFPVMTLLLKIEPAVARDFSLMIQSCGMTSAAFTIIWMGIALEWRTILIGSVGATLGCVVGLETIDKLLPAPSKKMLFVSIWFSFGLALFILNRQKKRVTFDSIPAMCPWKVAVLFATGFCGGLFTSFAGSGVDICSFAVITLLFRVSEKIATPTSVVLMACNTCVGFFWRALVMRDIDELAWQYWSVSIPVVVICAPLGSLFASHFHRLVLAAFVYVLEVAALAGFLATRPDRQLIVIGGIIICSAFAFFCAITAIGNRLHVKNVENHGRVSNL